ncbi:MAG: dihydroorotate dehydrogenase electron transfer subunit [Candidatus Latescibacteria bacterium]|nr:dihydroorotate dehydrogenase electron transfer subunit [Candidatus Latescibacterota bacterium]
MIQETGRILSHEAVAEGIHLLRIEVPRIAASIRPAQFVNVRVAPAWDPFLRRPFSALRRDRAAGWVDLLYEVVGPGTLALSRLRAGDGLEALGPLGQPYVPEAGRVVLVGGGVGIVPLAFWAAEEPRSDAVLLFGAARRGRLPDLRRLIPAGLPVEVATDDGSVGHRGFVTDLMARHLAPGDCQVFCCGPTPMMKAAAGIAARFGVSCHVSLENHMACGFGACVGCVVEHPAEADPYRRYRRVCVEGPVFDASQIAWP